MKKLFCKKGFTFIELMVTIAIMGILATITIVYSTSYMKRARASKALAELSSRIPSMYACWGNGGTVVSYECTGCGTNNPDGKAICQFNSVDAPSYGTWPVSQIGDFSSYVYGNFAAATSKVFRVSLYSPTQDATMVCCNSTMKGCKILTANSPDPDGAGVCSAGMTCTDTCPPN